MLSLACAAGCGGDAPLCVDPTELLAPESASTVSCEQADDVRRWAEKLASRPFDAPARQRFLSELQSEVRRDPAAGERVAAARAELRTLQASTGLPAARLRSEAIHRVHDGGGPFPTATSAAVSGHVVKHIAVWADDDASGLSLTEMDVEGWLSYASLCREAQGAGPLRISVADRVVAYRQVIEQFEARDAAGKAAMVSVGPFWADLSDTWRRADFQVQHAWIGAAPLPPPMTSMSLGYLTAVLDGDLPRHVSVLHDKLGPLSLMQVK